MAAVFDRSPRPPRDRRRALLVGNPGMTWHLPPVIHAAGFDVDVVTMPSIYLRVRRYVDRVILRPDPLSMLLAAAQQARQRSYDWVVVTDDGALAILGSDEFLPLADRFRLAPVVGPEYLSHLGSKAQLSQWLEASGVVTPDFRVCADLSQARGAAQDIGYPVVLKADRSGGFGVRVAADDRSLAQAWSEVFSGGHVPPAVVQRFVPGPTFDLSTLFWNGTPVSITVAQTLRYQHRYGPSVVRRYLPRAQWGDAAADLAGIGKGLGLQGFSNVSAIRDAAGRFHFFEVDARPSQWPGGCHQVGARVAMDLAAHLRDGSVSDDEALQGDFALFRRLSKREVLTDQYGVWRSIPWRNPDAVLPVIPGSLSRVARRSLSA